MESEACGFTLCNGNGKCATQNGATVCVCEAGYSGELCQDVSGGLSQGPVLYGVIGLCVAVVVLGVTVGIIQKKKATNRRYTVIYLLSFAQESWNHIGNED